ncbi:MAG: [Fe-Fe] hydrogenase large subunit C-terminal domain-containing protein [Candidatus Muiribacteriota bacterium]
MDNIIYTNKTECRDCYKCLRNCPVKAIKMENHRASIDDDLCIYCGTCIKVCPKKAKEYRKDLNKVLDLISIHKVVTASIAPSLKSLLSKWEFKRIPSALRKAGFNYVAETVTASKKNAACSAAYLFSVDHSVISSCCPAVVTYIEKYYPELIPMLVPSSSPLILNSKALKKIKPEVEANVFISPCTAKKYEAERAENINTNTVVITFEELFELFFKKNIKLSELEESEFDFPSNGTLDKFPLNGGIKNVEEELANFQTIIVDGFKKLDEICRSISSLNEKVFVEILFCDEGCINGPGIKSEIPVYHRKRNLENKESKIINVERENLSIYDDIDSKQVFKDKKLKPEKVPTEDDIKNLLELTGKGTEENQLNCGACGYDTCRDKAFAHFYNRAEVEMCIPYMRRLAESKTDKIMQSSPNGIVILDSRLNIISLNKQFKKYFMCSDSSVGLNIAKIIDPGYFDNLVSGRESFSQGTVNYSQYNLICHQMLYKLPEENQYVGIFIDITKLENNQKYLQKVKKESILKVRQLIEHQIETSQKLAKMLGDNTAVGETILDNLMEIFSSDKDRS